MYGGKEGRERRRRKRRVFEKGAERQGNPPRRTQVRAVSMYIYIYMYIRAPVVTSWIVNWNLRKPAEKPKHLRHPVADTLFLSLAHPLFPPATTRFLSLSVFFPPRVFHPLLRSRPSSASPRSANVHTNSLLSFYALPLSLSPSRAHHNRLPYSRPRPLQNVYRWFSHCFFFFCPVFFFHSLYVLAPPRGLMP